MCIKTKKCQAWISLESVGISAEGCMRDFAWLHDVLIPCNQSIFEQSLYIDLPTKKLRCLKNVAHGKFGYIDLAQLNTQNKTSEIYVKRPILSGKSLLIEACIQKLVGESLTSIGFPTGAPELLSVFRLKDDSVCFAMEQINGSITLDRYLESIPASQFLTVIVECLLQVSAMTWHLDSVLGINHRDLKPSNFLIVEHEGPKTKVIQVGDDILEIISKYSLTFIDFGFSCLGSTETHNSDISLSTVYSKSDPCPKDGRDLYLFLAFLYIDYHHRLPQQLLILFESWLNIPGSSLCGFMKKDKENAKKWIYFIAGNQNIKKFNSCPCKIVKDLRTFIEA
jgi:serine/threonine protein kinase